MLVSVIVPVRNEAANIRQTLGCLLRQDLDADQFEVIVVDGESVDQTAAIVREMQPLFRNLRLLSNPKRLSSAARNLGVRDARGRMIVIVDGHCAIDDPRYLTHVVEAFEKSGADTLGRPQPLKMDQASPFQEAVSIARGSWLGHNPDSDIYSDRARFVPPDNVAVAYRREVFDKVGLFDEQFDACEDVEFNTRVRHAGLTCYFTPVIRVDYQPRGSLGGLLHQMFRYGIGRSRLGRKHPSSITLPSLVPVLWLLWLPLTFALGFFSPIFAAAFCLSVLIYSLSIFGESLRLSLRHPARLITRTPLVFFAIHIGFGWGFMRDRLTHLGK
ncbi:MAG: glycosyltransferase family 2 protein [Planctomycetes bacterium]|nr:glycosyltransferase family 2 protein [Planctomycetota bacterium]